MSNTSNRDIGTMPKTARVREEDLYKRVVEIIEAARRHVARSVNSAMVHAYWLIGREIVEVEQQGKERAAYGEQLIRRLSDRLSATYGKGFSYPSVKRMKQFYLTFPKGSAIPLESGSGQKGSALQSQSSSVKRSVVPIGSTCDKIRSAPPSELAAS